MKKFYKYWFTSNDIVSKEITENEFLVAPHGFTIEDDDLTDHSRLVPAELKYNHRITVEYFSHGLKQKISIDNIEFESRIVFNESLENHPTLRGYMLTRRETYEIKWYNPYVREAYSVRLSSEFPYNAGILGLHTIYFLYLTHHSSEDGVKRSSYLWSILNSRMDLFDTGGSQINLSNFKFGDFVDGIKSLYDDYILESDTYPFTKKFYNDNIKEALKIWNNEHRRLFLCNDNFQID